MSDLARDLRKLIRAYHGSPHSFDVFDPFAIQHHKNIGGTGHYFATDPEIATHYRGDQLPQSGQITGGKLGPYEMAADNFGFNFPEEDMSMANVQKINKRAEYRNLVDRINRERKRLKGLGEEKFQEEVQKFVEERVQDLTNNPDAPMIDSASATFDDPEMLQYRLDALEEIRKEVAEPDGAVMQQIPYQGEMKEVDLDLDQASEVVHGQLDPETGGFAPNTGDETMHKLYEYVRKQGGNEDLRKLKDFLDIKGKKIDPVGLERSLGDVAAREEMRDHNILRMMSGMDTMPFNDDYFRHPTFQGQVRNNIAGRLHDAGIRGYKHGRAPFLDPEDAVFVVNPNAGDRINILRKYAIPGLTAAGAAAAGSQAEAASGPKQAMNLLQSLQGGNATSIIPVNSMMLRENDFFKQQFIEANGVDAYNRAVETGGAYVDANGFKEIPPGSPFTRGVAATGVDPFNPRRNELLIERGGEAGPAPRVVGGETQTNLMRPDKYFVVQPDGSVARSDEFMGSVENANKHYFAKELQFPDGGYLFHKGVDAQPAMRPSIGVDPSVGNQGVRIYGGNVLGDIRMTEGGKNREYRDLLAITREGGTVPKNMERLKSLLLGAGAAGAAGQAEAAMPNAQQPQQPEAPQLTDTQNRYIDNLFDYVTTQTVSQEYIKDVYKATRQIMGEEAGQDLIGRMYQSFANEEYGLDYPLTLMLAATETQGDIGEAQDLLISRLNNMDEITLKRIGDISQQHFDGKYKIPAYRTQEQLDELGEKHGGNPDQYLTPEAVKNHSYLRGADLALAGRKDDFYDVRPQFYKDGQQRPFGLGMAAANFDVGMNAIPFEGDEEVERRLSSANDLYGVANIPKTLAPEMQTVMLPDGTPRYYRYMDDTVMGKIGNIAGKGRENMNPVGRLQNTLFSYSRPLNTQYMEGRTGINNLDIRKIMGFMETAGNRPVGVMPEGETPKSFAEKVKRYKDYIGKVDQRTVEEAGPAAYAAMGFKPQDRRYLSSAQAVPLNLARDAVLDVSNLALPFLGATGAAIKAFGEPVADVAKAGYKAFRNFALSPKDDAVAEMVAGTGVGAASQGKDFFTAPDAETVGAISGTTATDPDFFKKFDAGSEEEAKKGAKLFKQLRPLYINTTK